MMNRLLAVGVLLALAVVVSSGRVEKTLIDQCLPPVDGAPTLCLSVKSFDCFEIHANLMVNGQNYFNQSIPIPGLIRQVKFLLENPPPGTPKNYACYSYNVGVGTLKACVNVTELKVDGDDLKFCGDIIVEAASVLIGNFARTFHIPCLDVQDCKLFGCPNQCSGHGTCGSLGICECKSGFTGPDCSLNFDGTCIQSDFAPKTCWKTFFPDCHTVEFEVNLGTQELFKLKQDLTETKSLTLMPCQNLTGFDQCQVCVVADNITVQDKTLNGCPIFRVKCDEIIVEQFETGCMTIASSTEALCLGGGKPDPNNPVPTTEHRLASFGTARVVMWVAVGAVVVVLLAAGGYFVFVRFIKKRDGSLYGYDVVQLNAGADDDDDVAPLKSPFSGSSEDEA